MKITHCIYIIVLLIFSPLLFASDFAVQLDEFKSSILLAFKEKNVKKLTELTFTKGMSELDIKQYEEQNKMLLTDEEIDKVIIEPLPKEYPTMYVHMGKKYETTTKPIALIKVIYKKNENGAEELTFPYCLVNGKFYKVGTKSIDLNWKGPKDKNIGFIVFGKGSENAKILVKWNASGVDLERKYKITSSSFFGQYIDEVEVISENEDSEIYLMINEEGKEIYKSEKLIGKGIIKYKRKG